LSPGSWLRTEYPRSSWGGHRQVVGVCQYLPKIAKRSTIAVMSTMNISLPKSLKQFVDEQVVLRGFGTSSEYVRQLIRVDQERNQLRNMLLAGAESKPGKTVGADYFDGLRKRIRSKSVR
jgi:antitoxin ParD1/3/4